MIRCTSRLGAIQAEQLAGSFFVGWPNPPSAQTHLQLLKASHHAILAVDEDSGIVVGFATALSDGFLCAYVSFLEVLPDYQGGGIGTALMTRMLELTRDLYAVDLLCDLKLQPFYKRLGMKRGGGMFGTSKTSQGFTQTVLARWARARLKAALLPPDYVRLSHLGVASGSNFGYRHASE